MEKTNKSIALSFVLIIYLISIAFAIWVCTLFPNIDVIPQVLLFDIIATIIIFAFSVTFKNSSIYDPYWSVIPPLIVGYLIWINPEGNATRQLIIFLLVLFWALRLTINWARGWGGFKHEDWRYIKLAKDTGKWYWIVSFLGIHLMPTLLVFAGCLPLFYLFQSNEAFSYLELITVVVTLCAILIEWVSDEQLRKYKKSSSQKKYMDIGLWSISRHPNYLGEITFWIGLFLFVPLSGLVGQELYTSIGFISMILLFRFISIPLMEQRNIKHREGYTTYMEQVSMLFPHKFRKSKC